MQQIFYEIPGPRKFVVMKLHYIYIPDVYAVPCAFRTENFRNIQLSCLRLGQGRKEVYTELQCGSLLELPKCKTKKEMDLGK